MQVENTLRIRNYSKQKWLKPLNDHYELIFKQKVSLRESELACE